MRYTDLAEDLVPVHSSGLTGDQEVEMDLQFEADEEFERMLPSDVDHWF